MKSITLPDILTEPQIARAAQLYTVHGMDAVSNIQTEIIEPNTSKLSEKARKEIRIALDVIEDQLGQNVPFVVKQFQEATTRVTSAAKAEVDAFVTGVVRAAGLEAIAGGQLPSLLPSGEATQVDAPGESAPSSTGASGASSTGASGASSTRTSAKRSSSKGAVR